MAIDNVGTELTDEAVKNGSGRRPSGAEECVGIPLSPAAEGANRVYEPPGIMSAETIPVMYWRAGGVGCGAT
jgi:hypothetical protein